VLRTPVTPHSSFGDQWNGSSWSLVTAANPPAASEAPKAFGMDCVSASDCIALGTTDSRDAGLPFAEQWNGSSWSLADTGIDTGLGDGK